MEGMFAAGSVTGWEIEPLQERESIEQRVAQSLRSPSVGTPSPIGTVETPATADFDVNWEATGPAVDRGSGNAGPPAEASPGKFAPARAVGTFSGAELGLDVSSNGKATSDAGYAEIGTERNGVFL